MEESKELQGFYKIFRAVIYISVLMEFFEYAIDPRAIDGFGGVVCDLHDRIKQWFIYHDGNLVYSKVVTFLLVCITCVGTRNKKHLEFDARRQVLYPLVSGVLLLILSVWLFGYAMDTRLYTLRLNTILYMVTTIIGTVLVHIALDNISKFLKEGLMKDRFNFENESFEQCQKEEYNKYSVNIPMRYYYKGKFRKGWVNIVNPFRGTWVVGTPGSGKTFSIIEPFIRQHSAKGFAMVVYGSELHRPHGAPVVIVDHHHGAAPAPPRPYFKPGVDTPMDVAARNFEAAMNQEVLHPHMGKGL